MLQPYIIWDVGRVVALTSAFICLSGGATRTSGVIVSYGRNCTYSNVNYHTFPDILAISIDNFTLPASSKQLCFSEIFILHFAVFSCLSGYITKYLIRRISDRFCFLYWKNI